ncbi:Clarin-3 [Tinamus guttatus]|uniref:Clarin-3 n=1 Tax=Tinamus guttatus TaxID=94827 RepID=A0A099ZAW4_TINGU|nr:PREDICTED: clarin-3 [Tinamus guttatus]KGL78862.1 Clarin-3 [Tinamus guttatus]
MPSREKTLLFAGAFCTSAGSFVLLCVVLATRSWVTSDIRFSQANSSVTVTVTYGLFQGTCEQTVTGGLQISESPLQVTETLKNAETRATNVAIIVLLVLALLSSLLSAGFTGMNVVSNPYQTFLGPIGVYTWNVINGILTLLVLILFAVNIERNRLSVELAEVCYTIPTTYMNSKNTYGYSYWIMLLIIFLNIATIIIIYFYDHARYYKKKEQERPIENAPKDVILF